ncbi:MAG: hypothetical protein B6245_01815 [Desulfobacteraceae bacterium 4572_88]|nr:MAG: hypothetical protein B6245_01815 [Desulfobacteraceae bacterium 4572_88]
MLKQPVPIFHFSLFTFHYSLFILGIYSLPGGDAGAYRCPMPGSKRKNALPSFHSLTSAH